MYTSSSYPHFNTTMNKQNISTSERPQPRTSPIVDSFTGDVGFSIEGISDHHMPLRYHNFDCVIDLLRIEMVNFQILRIKLIFTINGNLDNISKLSVCLILPPILLL